MKMHKNGLFNNPKETINHLNKIDLFITNSIHFFAEKKCRKLNAGNIPYTPEISKAGELINFWNTVVRKKNVCNISSKQIKRSAKSMKIHEPIQPSFSDCEHERKLSIKKYPSFKTMQNNLEQFFFMIYHLNKLPEALKQ